MNMLVCKAGILDSIQDGGRFGFGHLGINPNGAMDHEAMQTANLLVGNDMNTAVLEMHFPAPVLKFEKPAILALCGADFDGEINGVKVPLNRKIIVPANGVLSFGMHKRGMRCYLAVKGGFGIKAIMNSCSTNLVSGFGGYQGRALKKGDLLSMPVDILSDMPFPVIAKWFPLVHYIQEAPIFIRVMYGPEWKNLKPKSKESIDNDLFTIGPMANRMGYLLEGRPLHLTSRMEMLSSPVSFGTIQLLPSGQLMILMADHQTTGGYPRVLQVLAADLPKLAQARPGSKVQFLYSTIAEACALQANQRQRLNDLEMAIKLKDS